MPLPWLIAAAAAVVVTAVFTNSDDEPSGSSNQDDERRRREAAAEEERRKREREQKKDAALTLFKERSERMGEDLASALDGWVDVTFLSKPICKITSLSLIGNSIPNTASYAFRDSLNSHELTHSKTQENLDFYLSKYHVQVQVDALLAEKIAAIKNVDRKLSELNIVQEKLNKIRARG